jgi:hypothetical protein
MEYVRSARILALRTPDLVIDALLSDTIPDHLRGTHAMIGLRLGHWFQSFHHPIPIHSFLG